MDVLASFTIALPVIMYFDEKRMKNLQDGVMDVEVERKMPSKLTSEGHRHLSETKEALLSAAGMLKWKGMLYARSRASFWREQWHCLCRRTSEISE